MDEQLVKKRMLELANRSYNQGIYTFTDFLDISQLAMFHEMEREIGKIPYTVFGGTDGCERKIIRFGSQEMLGYEALFPITSIQCKPLMKKFSDDLSHRDFLGALMNLGVKRDTLGDIMVEDKECIVFCLETIAPYIIQNLQKVKHTNVACAEAAATRNEIVRKLEEAEEIVASERIDTVLAKICHLSRSQCVLLFREKKIFLNGRQCENNAYVLKKDDILSIRGVGKFVYDGKIYTTKKEKLRIAYRRYI